MRSNSSSSWKNRFPSFKRQDMKTGHGRRETSWYIEHLESELASAISRVESDDSSAHGARYRALNSEYKLVKQELVELEQNFEARVQEEIAVVAEREAQLRARVRAMEKGLETKDNKIRELEWEIEMDAHRLRQLESVNSTNRSLERRVDVLTELLAQSPTRAESTENMPEGPDASPVGTEGQGLPRRRSLFSKSPLPLSPLRRPLSQSIGTGASNEPLPPPDFIPSSSLEEQTNDSGLIDAREEEDDDGDDGMTGGVEPGFEDPHSAPSNYAPVSQRASVISSSSSNLSFPLSPDAQSKMPHRRRKMRRFPSGSYTLKPLVLPSTSTALSPTHHLASPTQRPGTANSSIPGHSYAVYDDSPLFGGELDRQREATLNALEGNAGNYQSFEDAMANHGASKSYDSRFSDGSLDVGRSEYLNKDSLTLTEVFETPTSALGGWMEEPRKRSSGQRVPSSPLLVATTLAKELEGSGYSTIRSAPRNISNAWSIGSKVNDRQVVGSSARAADAPPVGGLWKHALNIHRIASYCRTLSRRILTKAWHSNWKRVGSFSWWFLGFILGPQTRNHWLKLRLQKTAARQETENRADASGKHPDGSPDCAIPCPPTLRSTAGTTRLPTTVRPRPAMVGEVGAANILSDNSLPSLFAQNPSRSLQLWMKFSATLVLALGLAVKDGPASLMCDCLPDDSNILIEQTTLSSKTSDPPDDLPWNILPESPSPQYATPSRRPLTPSRGNDNSNSMRRGSISRYDVPDFEPG